MGEQKNEMIITTPLKIWTLISHAFILIGLGHGIATLGIAEVFWLSTIFEGKHFSGGDGHVSLSTLQLVAFMCIAGQAAVVTSVILSRSSSSKWILLAGHSLLWASVITYAYRIIDDNYAHLAFLSCIPLVYCTVRTLFGGHIQLLWKKIYARI